MRTVDLKTIDHARDVQGRPGHGHGWPGHGHGWPGHDQSQTGVPQFHLLGLNSIGSEPVPKQVSRQFSRQV